MGKLFDQIKHIGEFDVCIKCEFETKFLHIVLTQTNKFDIGEDDICNENKVEIPKEYEDDQSNEHENKEQIKIPKKR